MAKKFVLILLAVLSLSLCFALVACNGDDGGDVKHEHKHVYSDEWLYDATSHWHKAVCHDETSEKSEHTLIDNMCYICGYNALTSSSGDTTFEVGLRCEDYNGDSSYKVLTSAASIVTDLKVYTKDRKPIIAVNDKAFKDNNKIKTATFGKDVMLVGESAFANCSELEEVVFENSAVIIQTKAFEKCAKLKKITFGNSVISIGADAFAECPNLEEVNVTDVDSWCNIIFTNEFSNPASIAQKINIGDCKDGNVVISNNIKKIGSYAFNNCKNITGVELPNTIVSIGADAFLDCDNLSNVNYRGTIGQWCEIFMYSRYSNPLNFSHKLNINGEVVTEVTIPDGVIKICDYAFVSCDNIKKVSIPNSVLIIGDGILFDVEPESVVYRGEAEDWTCVGLGTKNESWSNVIQFQA